MSSSSTSAARDAHGNPWCGPTDAIAPYDRAIDRYLRFNPEVLDLGAQLVAEHPEAPMGHALWAYLHLSGTDRPDLPVARAAHGAMAAAGLDRRAAAHHDTIGAWLAGDWAGAAERLDGVLQRWPTDLLALLIGHQLDFFLGDAANLRDRPGRSLAELDPDDPHTPFVRGMQAFGLEEAGSYGAAEHAGLAAVDAHPDDVWAIHAVVHTYEMQGRVDEGIRFLSARTDDWGSGNLFAVHNWWHLALYHLEAGAVDEALRIYDTEVHHPGSACVPLEMLDASALLWRLHLEGHDTGTRFDVLASAWAERAVDPSWYVFNDLHAVIALVGAGRLGEAHRVVERLEGDLRRGGTGTNLEMTAVAGLPACRSIVLFGEGRYDDVVDTLAPARRTMHRFGGSHAQRDVLARTLLEAALRSDRLDLARSLTAERLALRDTSVYGWTQRARVLQGAGRAAEAEVAAATAAAHRHRFASALGTR